jgi:hypothetical protein
MAMMAQALQGGGSGKATYDHVQTQLVSEQLQLRIALGLNEDGTGNYNLSQAPISVRKASTTNTGDLKRKLGMGMEGGALAPGAMCNLQDTIQTGMSSEGYSLKFDICKPIVMCQFHKLHPCSFTAVGFGRSVIGDDPHHKFKALPALASFTPSGIEMLNLINGIIASRRLFDSGSFVAINLEQMKLRLEKAQRCNMSVKA